VDSYQNGILLVKSPTKNHPPVIWFDYGNLLEIGFPHLLAKAPNGIAIAYPSSALNQVDKGFFVKSIFNGKGNAQERKTIMQACRVACSCCIRKKLLKITHKTSKTAIASRICNQSGEPSGAPWRNPLIMAKTNSTQKSAIKNAQEKEEYEFPVQRVSIGICLF
jgi:hypothetical protein